MDSRLFLISGYCGYSSKEQGKKRYLYIRIQSSLSKSPPSYTDFQNSDSSLTLHQEWIDR